MACGNCDPGYECINNQCELSCTPTSCSANQCGNITNSCGQLLNCPLQCTGTQKCVNNQCVEDMEVVLLEAKRDEFALMIEQQELELAALQVQLDSAIFLLGDVNCDGVYDLLDAFQIALYTEGLTSSYLSSSCANR